MPQLCGSEYHFLRYSAYPIKGWLLIPFRDYDSPDPLEKTFNKQFCETRILIENTFGLLKGRFRQLLQIDMQKVTKISRFIISCCVIHNLCIENDDIFENEDKKILDEVDIIPTTDNDINLKKKVETKRLSLKNILQA